MQLFLSISAMTYAKRDSMHETRAKYDDPNAPSTLLKGRKSASREWASIFGAFALGSAGLRTADYKSHPIVRSSVQANAKKKGTVTVDHPLLFESML